MRITRNWTNAAGVIWPMLVEAGSRHATLTYEDVAPAIRTNPLSVGKALGPIQFYCIENRLAPLTAVVVGKHSHAPGTGFVAWDVDDLDAAWDAVAAQNWSLVGNPFAGFGPDDDEKSFAGKLVAQPDRSGDVYRTVRDRGVMQRIFRLALLEAYESKCAMCALSFSDALEGAHIVPWGDCDPEHRLDVRNGILLCASHHRLYDCDVFVIEEDLTITYYDPEAKDGEYGDTDRSFALALHRTKPTLPRRKPLRPNPDFIRRRISLRTSRR